MVRQGKGEWELKMDGNKCPKQWNCPHCNEFYDSEKQSGEEYTVSRSYPNFIPHIICPKCKQCMGCLDKGLQ